MAFRGLAASSVARLRALLNLLNLLNLLTSDASDGTAVNYIPPLVLKKLEDGVSEGADDGSGIGVEGELGCVVPFVGIVTGVVAGQSFVEEDAGLGVVSTEGMVLTSTSAWSTVGEALASASAACFAARARLATLLRWMRKSWATAID